MEVLQVSAILGPYCKPSRRGIDLRGRARPKIGGHVGCLVSWLSRPEINRGGGRKPRSNRGC